MLRRVRLRVIRVQALLARAVGKPDLRDLPVLARALALRHIELRVVDDQVHLIFKARTPVRARRGSRD